MKLSSYLIVLSCFLVFPLATAGMLAEKTRLIFDEGQNSKSLMLANTNEYAVILQTWIDKGEGSPDTPNIPFVTLPAVAKIAVGGTQAIRVISNGDKLPHDRESIFWLNLYEIPAVKKTDLDNPYLSLAMNTQLKVFYRPKELKEFSAPLLAKRLKFFLKNINGNLVLVCQNPTAYHASLINLQIVSENMVSNVDNEMDFMSYPFSQREYPISGALPLSSSYLLKFSLIDDNGNQQSFEQMIKFS